MAALDKIMDALPEQYLDPNTSLGEIGNIYLNVGYLYSLIVDDSLTDQDKNEKKDINLYNYLKSILSGVNTAIGNVANLDVFVDPVDSIAKIIDVNCADLQSRDEIYNNAFVLEVHNLRSTVRSYNFEAQTYPEQSTSTAIGAQAGGDALGSDAITQQEFNKGLTDRVIPFKTNPPTPEELADKAKADASKLENLKTNLQVLANYSADLDPNILEDLFGWGGDFDASQASKYSNALKDIINYYKSITNDDTKNKAILPTKLSLEMDGIGGIVVGQLFRINEDLLPEGYKGNSIGSKIAYTVTSIGHSIQNNDWITKLGAKFIALDNPKGVDGSTWKTIKARTIPTAAVSNTININNNTGNNIITNVPSTPTENKGTEIEAENNKGITRSTKSCKKSLRIVTDNTVLSKIPSNTSWANIKKSFPIINGNVSVQAIGTPYDSGTDFKYKMKSTKVSPRSGAINYIVLHYTVSNKVDPTFHYQNTWESRKASCDFTIGRNGHIAGFKNYKKYRAWQYGAATWPGGENFNDESIGFEIEALGYCSYCMDDDSFYTTYDSKIDPILLSVSKPYRGHNIWHKLSDVQISATANLIAALYNEGVISNKTQFLSNCIGTNRYTTLFPESPFSQKPAPGIITHGTGRKPSDKQDVHPQDNLLQMLDDLPNILQSTGKNNRIKWTV